MQTRAANSTRIRESILAMILVTLRYANQFLSFNYYKMSRFLLNLILPKCNKFTPANSKSTGNKLFFVYNY